VQPFGLITLEDMPETVENISRFFPLSYMVTLFKGMGEITCWKLEFWLGYWSLD
jgi:hypothetical protein